MIVEVNDKEYSVKVAYTEEEKIQGLQGIEQLPENEGMLFVYDEPQTVQYWMKDTLIPLDIVFINDDEEVISVYHGNPNDETLVEEDDVKYVLEVNINSGITEGDEVDIDDDETESDELVMQILGPKGEVQGEIQEGSRIFSRKNTVTLIRLAKRAKKTKKDSDYKKLGKKMFQFLDEQDNRSPQYVQVKE